MSCAPPASTCGLPLPRATVNVGVAFTPSAWASASARFELVLRGSRVRRPQRGGGVDARTPCATERRKPSVT